MTTELEAAAVALNHGAGEPVKTLLDEFAMTALSGILSHPQGPAGQWHIAAQNAYEAAESMMAVKLRRERGK